MLYPEYVNYFMCRVMSAGLDRSDLLSVSGWGKAERGRIHGGFTLGKSFRFLQIFFIFFAGFIVFSTPLLISPVYDF
jgi:hypothetical protein